MNKLGVSGTKANATIIYLGVPRKDFEIFLKEYTQQVNCPKTKNAIETNKIMG